MHILMHNKYDYLKNNNLIKFHPDDAGWDIKSPAAYTIVPGSNITISTGLHVQLPKGYVGLIKSRSSLALKHNIECSNAGVIDAGYQGEIIILLYNHNLSRSYAVAREDRIAQLIILPCLGMSNNYPPCFQHKVLEIPFDQWPDSGQRGVGSTGR